MTINGDDVIENARLFQGDIPVGYCDQYLPAGAYSEVIQYPNTKGNFWVIFNTAVYRPFADNETVDNIPAELEIDYVKIYTRTKCPDSTPVACHEGTNNPIVFIDQDTEWDECETKNVADQFKYITVRNNSTLEIKDSDIKMLLPGHVIVESGSTLLLNNTTIRPCEEGTRWQGVYLNNGASIKMKNGSALKTSVLGIYNNPEFHDDISSTGEIDSWALLNSIYPNAGNNSIILNNSSLEDNFVGMLIDGDDNVISLVQGNTVKGSNFASLIRGNMNGYIEYKNTNFENNLVSLWAYNCGDRHVIQDCDFVNSNNVTTQITLRNVDGLDFQMNKMEGPGQLFDAFESHVDIVNGNQFLNAQSALWVAGAYPLASGARIGDLSGAANYFSGNASGIKVNGLNSSVGGLVRNNQIENTNRIAIDVDGISLSNINNNSIDNAEDGIYFSKTGGLDNFINCNRFENNSVQDLTIELDNNNTLFLQNDFSGSQNEGNIILSQADVRDIQGSPANPSDNCFDPNAVEDLYTDVATSFFQYHHNNAIPCMIPSGNGNYQPLNTQSTGDNCQNGQIGSNFSPPGGGHTPIRLLPPLGGVYTGGIVDPNVTTALNNLLTVGGDDPYTYADESLPSTEILPNATYAPSYLANIETIYDYESELDYWIRAGIQYAMTNDDYSYGESLLLPLKKWRWQEMLFGLYMKSSQYTKAIALLNALPNNTAYEVKFVDLQHINLDRIINGEQSITPAQIQTVYDIATGNTPAVGYAIPIYYHLTGIRLLSSVPTKNGGTRNSRDVTLGSGLSIVPNPAMDQLMLQNEFNKKLSEVAIIDRQYQVKIKLTADNLDQINISNLVSGWYMLRCIVDNKEIITLPFVKL